jgi:hypothetical protein
MSTLADKAEVLARTDKLNKADLPKPELKSATLISTESRRIILP